MAGQDQGHRVSLRVSRLVLLRLPQVDLLDELRHSGTPGCGSGGEAH